MKKEEKNKSITIRINSKLYDNCVKEALNLGKKENRIINVSEIIRILLEKGIKDV